MRQNQSVKLTEYGIIFFTPSLLQEGAFSETIKSLSEQKGIERIVFDEALTISSWGTTFPPPCKDVFEKVASFQCPKLLLSASSGRVLSELKDTLTNLTVLRQPIIRERPDQIGIIYCILASNVGKVHGELRKRNISCVKYHSQLADTVKQERCRNSSLVNQECWLQIPHLTWGLINQM